MERGWRTFEAVECPRCAARAEYPASAHVVGRPGCGLLLAEGGDGRHLRRRPLAPAASESAARSTRCWLRGQKLYVIRCLDDALNLEGIIRMPAVDENRCPKDCRQPIRSETTSILSSSAT